MADRVTTPTKPAPTFPGPEVHRTKKRAKASSPAHADAMRVRKLAAEAIRELTRTVSMEKPTNDQISASLAAFEALMVGPLAVCRAAIARSGKTS